MIECFVGIHVCRAIAKTGFIFVLVPTAVVSFPFAHSTNPESIKVGRDLQCKTTRCVHAQMVRARSGDKGS